MLKDNIENHGKQQDEVELSRRGFFGRLAVGAFLSIGMPGAVYAAKSAAVKAEKNHRLAQSAKSAARLPKHSDLKAVKGVRHPNNVAASHALGKHQKGHAGKTAAVEHGRLHTAHANHPTHGNTRVHDVYGGGKHSIHTASHHTGRHYGHGGGAKSITPPMQQYEPFSMPEQEPFYLANHGRFSTHRTLAFQNPHTGDKLSLTYFEKGRYLSDALDEISFLLRDYRTGDVHAIDPELLDQLHDLKQILALNQPFDIVCGYRSPLTNAQLHAEHSGVASNSFHMHGRAIDIRIERFDLRRIHNAALAMHRGGVGYYPDSNFIHLDTGSFRTWSL